MLGYRRSCRDLVGVLFTLSILINFARGLAGRDSSTASSTFVYHNSDTNQEFVFALHAADNGDLYFHLSAPSGSSWIAVGIGEHMKNALMFIAYPSETSGGITLSPRVATSHSEPTYDPSISLGLQSSNNSASSNGSQPQSNTVTDTAYHVSAVCHNCSTWSRGSLNLSSTAQPFIFALGPPTTFASDSVSAALNRHQYYGHFTLDLTRAVSAVPTSSGIAFDSVPKPNGGNGTWVTSGASQVQGLTADHNRGPPLHAVLMIGAFVLVFPFGALVLRVLERVILHAIGQVIGFVLVLTAFCIGIYISTLYNRSKHFSSAHQILGLLIFLCLSLQLGLGLLHHRIYRRNLKAQPQPQPQRRQPTVFSKIHRYLGPTVLFFGIVNAPLGFNLAGNSHYNAPYAVIVIGVALAFAAALWLKKCFVRIRGRGRGKGSRADADDGYQNHWQGPGGGGAYGLQEMPPPVYDGRGVGQGPQRVV